MVLIKNRGDQLRKMGNRKSVSFSTQSCAMSRPHTHTHLWKLLEAWHSQHRVLDYASRATLGHFSLTRLSNFVSKWVDAESWLFSQSSSFWWDFHSLCRVFSFLLQVIFLMMLRGGGRHFYVRTTSRWIIRSWGYWTLPQHEKKGRKKGETLARLAPGRKSDMNDARLYALRSIPPDVLC